MEQLKWYAARVRDKQELSVRSRIEKLQIISDTDLECYLPTRIVVRQLKYRRKRVEIPIIRNLIFIRATQQAAVDLPNKEGIPLFYMKDLLTGHLLVVPDKQMEDFRFVMDLDPAGVSFDLSSLTVGSRVKVVKGDFQGIEGEVATCSGKTYVMINIQGILTASVKVPKSYLQLLS